MTRVEKNAEELRRKDATMNDFKSKLDDLLDELERCCASQHFEVANDIRAKIHKLIKNNIPLEEYKHDLEVIEREWM